MWPRLCSAPLREGLRAALRPGHVKKFPFINIKSREFLSRIPKPRLSCRRPVHEGALHEAFLRWGGMRRLRTCLASTDSGGFGFPSGPTTGLCLEWLDGAGARGREPSGSWRKPLLVPEARPQGQKSPRRNVERRCRAPLFPGDPGNKPRPLPRCAFRRPVSPHCRGERTKSPTRAAARERSGVAV